MRARPLLLAALLAPACARKDAAEDPAAFSLAFVEAARSPAGLSAELVDAVWSDRVDLLVMGESGRGNMTRLLEGNTVEKVLRVAPCSILRVNPAP